MNNHVSNEYSSCSECGLEMIFSNKRNPSFIENMLILGMGLNLQAKTEIPCIPNSKEAIKDY